MGLPRTGLSWRVVHSPAEVPLNNHRFCPGHLPAFRQGNLVVHQESVFAPGSDDGQLLWKLNLFNRVLAVTKHR